MLLVSIMPIHLDWPPERTPSVEQEYGVYAEIYDLTIGVRTVDVDFYVANARATLPAAGVVLELGTGTGRMAERLVDAGFRVVGVDSSREMLARAEGRAAHAEGRFEPVRCDVRTMALGRTFRMAIAPFAMMAHLLTERDRLDTMRAVLAHLEPGGVFLYDDIPGWLSGPSNGEHLEVIRTTDDPVTGMQVRLMATTVDVAREPLTATYYFIDWLEEQRLVRRLVARHVFRNTALDDELGWLREAGFERVELVGGFDGRPFDREHPAANERLILRCHKPSAP